MTKDHIKEAISDSVSTERALDLALEALEFDDLPLNQQNVDAWDAVRNNAITAIKQARSAPYVASPRVQSAERGEPVGTYGEIYESMQSLLRSGLQSDQQIYAAMKDKPLYTTPPAAQRQWVGLPDEEILKLAYPIRWQEVDDFEADRAVNFAQAIEAKLKEKNT